MSRHRVLSIGLAVAAGCTSATPAPEDGAPRIDATVEQDAALDAPEDRAPTDATVDAMPERWPAPMRAGACARVRTELPNNTWETATVFDPGTRSIVWSGGHVLGSYVQSSYAVRLATEDFHTIAVRSPRPPQRRCLVDAAFAQSVGRAVYAHGYIDHGSIAPGNFLENWTRIGIAETPGPWLFDPAQDAWSDARPSNNRLDQRHHAAMAWDAATDTVYALRDNGIQLYNVRANTVTNRAVPEALANRMFYAIAADPVSKRIVVFGGSKGQFRSMPGDTSANYLASVKDDTWLYDPATDQWEQVETALRPPRGIPGFDFTDIPSVWESSTGNVIIRVTPLSQWNADPTRWPDAETWAFNVRARSWTKLELSDQPKFMGLLNFDSLRNRLVIVGGGRDAGARPALSRELFDCSLPTAGAPLAAIGPTITAVESVDRTTNVVRWDATANASDVDVVVWRALANPVPSGFVEVGRVRGAREWTDRTAPAATAVVYELRVEGRRASAPRASQPAYPEGLRASVESATRVALRWERAAAADVIGYKVYRARGGGGATLLTMAPIADPTFIDTTVDLSDRTARRYWVTALNRGGVESGTSPQAYTFPEAPTAADVTALGGGEFELRWSWPADVRVDHFDVYRINTHENTNSQSDPFGPTGWYGRVNAVVPTSTTERSLRVRVDPSDTAPHQYFWIRAVNVLAQRGMTTDLLSATDIRFVPHVSARYAPP